MGYLKGIGLGLEESDALFSGNTLRGTTLSGSSLGFTLEESTADFSRRTRRGDQLQPVGSVLDDLKSHALLAFGALGVGVFLLMRKRR